MKTKGTKADKPKDQPSATGMDVVTVNPHVSPSVILQDAIQGGASIDVIERLLAVQERWEANQARKEFDAAMAAFRASVPKILKDKRVDFTSARTSGRTAYAYEDLGSMVNLLSPVLAEHGLSFRWSTESPKVGEITVTCIVAHAAGHLEKTALTGPYDISGNKNPIQAMGSAVTYLERYTLKAALGIAASDDDDGNSSAPGVGRSDQYDREQSQPVQFIQQEQRPAQSAQRTKQTHCQAHTDLGEAIKKFCADRPGTDMVKILEEASTVVRGNSIQPGVKDVLYLTELEAVAALGKVRAMTAARPPVPAGDAPQPGQENARHPKVVALGKAVIEYVKAHKDDFKGDLKAGNFLVLEDLTGMTNLKAVDSAILWGKTITPQVAAKALEKFEREYEQKK